MTGQAVTENVAKNICNRAKIILKFTNTQTQEWTVEKQVYPIAGLGRSDELTCYLQVKPCNPVLTR
jgi:hypothetical protein